MSVDAASLPARRARARLAAVPAGAVVAGIVGVSFAVRALAARLHPTPLVLPDEYTYAELARSLAETGRPLVRGGSAGFPALLEPLLTAPFWLAADAETAYRLTQSFHALAMSLAAVPAYLLARRVGLPAGFSVGCAAFAVAGPALVYSLFVLADPIGYPLALTAVYLAVRALERPSAAAQLSFLGVAALACLARLQYLALVPAFLLAAALLDGRGAIARFRATLALLAGAVAAAAALGPGRLAGAYSGLLGADLDPVEVARWLPVDAMLLAYATGWVLVPGAAVGLTWALLRPRGRAERAFAALAAGLGGGLLLEAAAIATHDADRFQERYLIALVPLVPIAFGLALGRGRTAARAAAGLALALLALSARVPLSGYTQGQALSDAPSLWAVRWLERSLGTAEAGLLVAGLAAALALVAVAAALRPRRGAVVALGLAVAASGGLAAGAHAFDAAYAARARAAVFPDGATWVDRARLGSVTLVQTPKSGRWPALSQLFWNRSVRAAVRLPGGAAIDSFPLPRASVDGDGRLRLDGRVLRGPLLIATEGSLVRLRGARRVAATPEFGLWQPRGVPRLALLASGRFSDGSLSGSGSVTVWPDDSGWTRGVLTLALVGPTQGPVVLQLRGQGVSRRLELAPGRRRAVSIRVDTRHPFVLAWEAERAFFDGSRTVAARASIVSFARG